MVKEYIAAVSDEPARYELVTDGELTQDERIAGTVSAATARAAVVDALTDDDGDVGRGRAVIDALIAAGAVFGFDGFEENGCAAPTSFLLVRAQAEMNSSRRVVAPDGTST